MIMVTAIIVISLIIVLADWKNIEKERDKYSKLKKNRKDDGTFFILPIFGENFGQSDHGKQKSGGERLSEPGDCVDVSDNPPDGG